MNLPTALTIEGQRYVWEPAIDRQLCLRGKWEPPLNQKSCYYFLNARHDSEIQEYADWAYTGREDGGWHTSTVFFPTHELAEEYLLIAEGKWLPKAGDMSWTARHSTNGAVGVGYNMLHHPKDATPDAHHRHFPSAEQRTTYISKQQRLPTVQELNDAWNKTSARFSSINYFGSRQEGLMDYLIACWKNRFIANLIREKEGKGDGYLWYIDREGCPRWNENKNRLPVGCEYFATELGAKLYMEAMGKDLQYLGS